MFEMAVSYDVQATKMEAYMEKAVKIAKKMIAKHKPLEEIMEFTDLSKEEIEKLKNES